MPSAKDDLKRALDRQAMVRRSTNDPNAKKKAAEEVAAAAAAVSAARPKQPLTDMLFGSGKKKSKGY